MVNDPIAALGSAASERSATAEALQQALLGTPPDDASTTAAEPSAEPAAIAPAAADAISDTPSVLVALAARGLSPRRGAGPDQAEPSASTLPSTLPSTPPSGVHEAPAAEPRLLAMPTPAAGEAALSLLATPAVLTALQAGQMQPLWSHTTADTPRRADPARDGRHGPHGEEQQDEDPRDDEAGQPQADDTPAPRRADPASPWQECLSHTLRRLAPAAPLLNLAFAQWQRGRVVLLVSPRAAAWGERGWLHAVRWPAHAATLRGERFDARLHWHRPGANGPTSWWGVRTTRQQGLQLGRQLHVQAELPEDTSLAPGREPAAIELWLGPGEAGGRPQGRVLDVRIDAMARLWAALDPQWSVTVLACDHPLGEAGP